MCIWDRVTAIEDNNNAIYIGIAKALETNTLYAGITELITTSHSDVLVTVRRTPQTHTVTHTKVAP